MQTGLSCKHNGMAKQQILDDGEPRAELLRARELARQVRHSQRATWFPLLVFAILTFAAVPVNRAGHPSLTVCRAVVGTIPGARVCLAHNSAAFVYWPIALVLAYAVIAAFYVRQSRARGVGSRVRTYVIAGIVIAVALTAVSVWMAHTPPVGPYDILGWHTRGPGLYRFIGPLTGPACAIGLALLVLAAVERNFALLVVDIIYLIIVLVPINFGWTMTTPSRWAFLPRLVIEGSVLLVAAIGFAIAQRPLRREPA